MFTDCRTEALKYWGLLCNNHSLDDNLTLRHLCVPLQLQSDQDHGNGLVKYVLSGEGAGTIFVIDENNGDLHATRRLDREEKAFYILRATVVNKRTGQKLEPETEFTVKLHDINDNEPQFSKEVYTGSVPERSLIGKGSYWIFHCRKRIGCFYFMFS